MDIKVVDFDLARAILQAYVLKNVDKEAIRGILL